MSTRLWLGGAVSTNRDTSLLQRMALCRPLLIAVDGLNAYLAVSRDVFRTDIPRSKGQTGRIPLVEWPRIAIVQVIDHIQTTGCLEYQVGNRSGLAIYDRTDPSGLPRAKA